MVFNTRALFAGLAAVSILIFAPASPAQAATDDPVVACVSQADDGLAAQTVCISQVAKACLADPTNTALDEKIECVQREFVLWDRMMKREYAVLHKALQGKPAERLQQTQKLWVAYQKKDCRIPYALFTGEKAALGGPWCSVNEFALRAIGLRAWRRELGLAAPDRS